MTLSPELAERSDNKCEICFADHTLREHLVAPKTEQTIENTIAVCEKCELEIEKTDHLDANHLRCLNESMWTTVPAVQVEIYRLLQKLSKTHSWAADLRAQMYLEESTIDWAEATQQDQAIVHKDANGHVLQAGDTVTLIQDLNVKGSSLTAKRGTAVRRIRLDPDNAQYIEGKVDGQHIVILTQYVKKSN